MGIQHTNEATTLPEAKRGLVKQLVEKLSKINGVSAVVLGGSYASGTNHESSDIDLGLYYMPDRPFSTAAIKRIAQAASVDGMATVTGFYDWGPWVNGGAWIHTPQGKVDFLYRNLEQIRDTIAEAELGTCHHDYDQQPTYGFYSVIYLAELQICIPLYDPSALISKLKRSVRIYPSRLKYNIINDSLWSAEFSLLHAQDFAAQGDIYNTVGCLTRVVSLLTQALFALNERYFMRDKQVMDVAAKFSILPPGYVQQINTILGCPGGSVMELTRSVRELKQVWSQLVSLPEVNYKPKFQL